MPDFKDQGAISQGLIEQARAKNIDSGHLQMLGKQAASLYSANKIPLSDAVVRAIGEEDLGPEHTRRVCEFANQAAFQNEWEKGGSVRNVEFEGGPADPAAVLRELNDGARQPAVRVVSDYDRAPPKLASTNRIENEIFAGYTDQKILPNEVPSSLPKLLNLRDTINGAQDFIMSKISSMEIEKDALERNLAESASNEMLKGTPLCKIATAWTHFNNDLQVLQGAIGIVRACAQQRGISEKSIEKIACVKDSKIPNPEHPVISDFVEFNKTAAELKKLRRAVDVLKEQLNQVNVRIKEAASGASGLSVGTPSTSKRSKAQ